MKNTIKKIVLVCLVFALTITQFAAYAANDVNLLNLYEYDENFEYEDEIIGHALKSTVVKIYNTLNGTIEYSPVQFNADKLEANFEALCEEFESTMSTEEIAMALLDYLQENLTEYLSYGSPKRVEATFWGTGSGVVLSENGYIATNAHVASMSDNDKLQGYLSGLGENVQQDIVNLVEELDNYGVTLSNEQIQQLYSIILQDIAEDAKIINDEMSLMVIFPSATGEYELESGVKYEAEVVEIGTQEGIEGLTQDTAILKINANNLVSLNLSDSYPESNSKIVSAGFPGASEYIFEMVGSEESTLSVTMGTGQVARLVPVKGSKFQAIQITTTISGGNSGGPSVDSNLNIEGLNTYGSTEDERYAYMISSEFVSYLAQDCNVGQGDLSKTFLLGLQMLQQNYGISALECFTYVKQMQPDTPFIENLIKLAQEAPAEKYPVSLLKSDTFKMALIALVGLIVLILIILLITKVFKSNKKKTNYNDPFNNSFPGGGSLNGGSSSDNNTYNNGNSSGGWL